MLEEIVPPFDRLEAGYRRRGLWRLSNEEEQDLPSGHVCKHRQNTLHRPFGRRRNRRLLVTHKPRIVQNLPDSGKHRFCLEQLPPRADSRNLRSAKPLQRLDLRILDSAILFQQRFPGFRIPENQSISRLPRIRIPENPSIPRFPRIRIPQNRSNSRFPEFGFRKIGPSHGFPEFGFRKIGPSHGFPEFGFRKISPSHGFPEFGFREIGPSRGFPEFGFRKIGPSRGFQNSDSGKSVQLGVSGIRIPRKFRRVLTPSYGVCVP